jgi:two-component system chemotaxis sensor kinase CheA
MSEEEVARMSEEEIAGLIFSDNFSTADRVTEHAGRGQGMQLVKSIVTKNQGSYRISSVSGESFKIDIAIPTIFEPTEV